MKYVLVNSTTKAEAPRLPFDHKDYKILRFVEPRRKNPSGELIMRHNPTGELRRAAPPVMGFMLEQR
jgi:hypothetical protein